MQLSFHFTLQAITLKYLNLLQLLLSIPASFDPEKNPTLIFKLVFKCSSFL